jgi:hypothetical protein
MLAITRPMDEKIGEWRFWAAGHDQGPTATQLAVEVPDSARPCPRMSMRRSDHRRLRLTWPPAGDRLLVWFRSDFCS